MSSTTTEPPLVPLRLPSRAQWVLHHVLTARIERHRRSSEPADPLPEAVLRTVRKLEAGSLLFTPTELRHARESLVDHLRRDDVGPGERNDVRDAIARIDDATSNRYSLYVQ